MKVLHVIRPAEGGMKGHLMTLAQGLTERGIKIEVACPDGSAMMQELTDLGVKCHGLSIVGPISPANDLKSIRQLRKIISKGKYDIIHLHGAKAGMVGRIAAASAGCKSIILTVHNFIVYNEVPLFKRIIFRLSERVLSHATAKIITVSTALKRDLVTNYKISADKIVPVYNGIDVNRHLLSGDRCEIRKQNGLKPDELVVGTVARMAPQKGLEYLIKAIPEVLKNQEVKFLIAGDGPLLEELKNLSTSLGIENRVIFPGYLQDVPGFLACLDIFVVPSIAEGLSITTIEAMTVGLPVIASRTGGLPELVRHGENGLLVEPRNQKELTGSIIKLLMDPVRRIEMGNRGKMIASAEFNVKSMVDQTCRIYDEITRQNRD